MLKIIDSYQRKFKAYSYFYCKMFDVTHLDTMNVPMTGYVTFDDNPSNDFNAVFDDKEYSLHEYTGLDYIDGREAYDGDIFIDNEHGDLYRIYRVNGGFAISIPVFPSTFTGSSPYPLIPLADAQTLSWFQSSAKYFCNIHENAV